MMMKGESKGKKRKKKLEVEDGSMGDFEENPKKKKKKWATLFQSSNCNSALFMIAKNSFIRSIRWI